jgi:hypothetical protein
VGGDAVRAAVGVQGARFDAEVLDVDAIQGPLQVVGDPGRAVGDRDPDRPAADGDG